MVVPVFKLTLVVVNIFLLLYVCVLLINHTYASHKLTSWASIFHLMSCLWLGIRGMFWLFTVTARNNWHAFMFYILYWIPNPIEFGSFMLLPLFFAQIIYPNDWMVYWGYIRHVYIFFVSGLILFQGFWAFIAAIEETRLDACEKTSHSRINQGKPGLNCGHIEYSSDMFRLITATSFLILGCLQGIYAYKVHYLDISQYRRFMITSRSRMAIVNGILTFSFLSRACYQLLAMANVCHLPNIPIQGDEDVHFSIVFFFMIWDYLPVILLITTITSQAMGDNSYYTSSLLQPYMWLINNSNQSSNSRYYVSKNKSADKKKLRSKARGKGTHTYLAAQPQNYGYGLAPIDEESAITFPSHKMPFYGSTDSNQPLLIPLNPVMLPLPYGLPMGVDISKSLPKESFDDRHVKSPLHDHGSPTLSPSPKTRKAKRKSNVKADAIEIMRRDKQKQLPHTNSKGYFSTSVDSRPLQRSRSKDSLLFDTKSSSFKDKPIEARKSFLSTLHGSSQSLASNSLPRNSESCQDDQSNADYDYFDDDDDIDRCSLERFQAPSLRAISGWDNDESAFLSTSVTLVNPPVSISPHHSTLSHISSSSTLLRTGQPSSGSYASSGANILLANPVLTHYRRRRSGSADIDATKQPSPPKRSQSQPDELENGSCVPVRSTSDGSGTKSPRNYDHTEQTNLEPPKVIIRSCSGTAMSSLFTESTQLSNQEILRTSMLPTHSNKDLKDMVDGLSSKVVLLTSAPDSNGSVVIKAGVISSSGYSSSSNLSTVNGSHSDLLLGDDFSRRPSQVTSTYSPNSSQVLTRTSSPFVSATQRTTSSPFSQERLDSLSKDSESDGLCIYHSEGTPIDYAMIQTIRQASHPNPVLDSFNETPERHNVMGKNSHQ